MWPSYDHRPFTIVSLDRYADQLASLLLCVIPSGFPNMFITACVLPKVPTVWSSSRNCILWYILSNTQYKSHLSRQKLVDHSDVLGVSPVGAASTTFSFRLNTLLQWIWQIQLHDETIYIKVFGFDAVYNEGLRVYCLRSITVHSLCSGSSKRSNTSHVINQYTPSQNVCIRHQLVAEMNFCGTN